MLDFAKRDLAAGWACFALSFVIDLTCFDVEKYILVAVWAGFAPSGLMEVWRYTSQNMFWLQPGHVLRPTQLPI